MAMEWTKEQLAAIETKGSSILVAAAAGSGKTAVLVERIIRRICDPKDPVSVDRLLVLTFTEAAANEMKRKIATAMEERLREEPDNQWLRDQSLLVPSAHISTVHAFCKTILQNNIHKTSLPADFTLIDDNENTVLLKQALDQVLERYYARIEKKEDFRDLTVGYGGTKSDENLRNTILKLYHFVRSLAYPEQWLRSTAGQYQRVWKSRSLSDGVWALLLKELCEELVKEVYCGLDRIWHIVETEVPSDHKYFAYYQNLLVNFTTVFKLVLEGNADIATLDACAKAFVMPRTPVKTGLSEGTVNRINHIKKQLVTEPIKELQTYLADLEPERLERVILCSPRIRTLKQLVRQTERLHRSLKRERAALDFGDLEHEMMHLIADRKGRPTQVAKALQNRFVEILVDEYQDTNNIQETIFRTLSRQEKNIFMVGDLKQSIYRFRNADPNIFAEKYHRYLKGDGGVCIRLFKNFRSRREVVGAVNGVFSGLMKKETGGIDYTPEEYLIPGAVYPEIDADFTSELLLTDVSVEKENPESQDFEMSPTLLEAETVAKRIRRMVDNREIRVTDSVTGELRPVRLGDITILVRNKTRVAELEQMLAVYNIPTISEVGQKYLDSLEVLTVLNFLQIIDNPRQDIPLLAVLRSVIFRFTPEELAAIRLSAKGDFYTALVEAADRGDSKARTFLETLEQLRSDAVHQGVDQLIWQICHRLHYLDLVGAMPGGRVRQANLNLLYERGAEFEQGALRGLFRFMEYIESLRSNGADMKGAQAFSGAEDTVSIMTIHKSKGLEFPVVFLCYMDSEFNERDASASVIWHEDVGIAMDYVDTKLRIRYPTLVRQMTRERILRDSRAEEMRLFYVAMTRAKEKLVLSTLVGTRYDSWKKATPVHGKDLPAGVIRRQKSMRDWLLSYLLSHPSADKLREMADCCDVLPDTGMDFGIDMCWTKPEIKNTAEEKYPVPVREKEEPILPAVGKAIMERLEYEYPYGELGKIPVKMSVSELKRRNMPEEEYLPSILPVKQMVLTEQSRIGGAERGTITHYVMQHMDFAKTEREEDVAAQLDGMVQTGLISGRQRSAVSAKEILGFFQHPLGMRLKHATRIEREFDFYMEIPAEKLSGKLKEADKAEPVLLQGIADCFFYEDDGVVLIDYKTDRIEANEAEMRANWYKDQIEYYTEGLTKVLECPVKERYLYFLHCNEAVAI